MLLNSLNLHVMLSRIQSRFLDISTTVVSFPFGGDYLHKKSLGSPIDIEGGFIGVPIPSSDSDFALFTIAKIAIKTEDMVRFGYGGVVTVTPKTSFEILPSNDTENTTTSAAAGYFSSSTEKVRFRRLR